jgi:hypothetical protein
MDHLISPAERLIYHIVVAGGNRDGAGKKLPQISELTVSSMQRGASESVLYCAAHVGDRGGARKCFSNYWPRH